MISHWQMVTAEIAALSTSTTIPLEIVSETKFEADETVIINLDGSSVSSNTTAGGSNMSHIIRLLMMIQNQH